MHIRNMQKSDLGRIVEITAVAWGDMTIHKLMQDRHGVIGNMEWRERKVHEIESLCRVAPANVIVAVQTNTVVGYATFSINKEDKVGYVGNNAVDPSFQGKGIGAAMNRWIVQHFKEEGLRVARVSTMAHDFAAQRVYERRGFKEVARSIHYSLAL